jgi:AcrR family transcriptional regulator
MESAEIAVGGSVKSRVRRTSRVVGKPAPMKGDERVRQIEHVAAELFFRCGYQATSLRDIAEAVGIRPASLYHHFPSKQDLLFAVLNRTVDDLIDRGEQALMTESDAPEQLRCIVREFILYVAERPREGMVGDIEIEHLDDGNRAILLSKRDRYQRIVEQVVTAGNEQGVFSVTDVKLAVFAILGMCNHVTMWFRPGRARTAADIAKVYGELALRLVGHQAAASSPGPSSSTSASTG